MTPEAVAALKKTDKDLFKAIRQKGKAGNRKADKV
jgi:hypothetical protein